MSKQLTLTIHDHVNFSIDGLSRKEIDKIKKDTSFMVKGAFTTAAYKTKIWDGRESLFTDQGVGVLYNIEKVLDSIEELQYDIDNDIELIDERKNSIPKIPFIDENYFGESLPFELRDYQVRSVNSVIEHQRGLLDIGTNGGKSLICAALSKVYQDYLPSVIIVPTELLVTQTTKDYVKVGLDVVGITKTVKTADRAALISKHRHVILTNKLFMNLIEHFSDPRLLIIDEGHVFGDVFADIIRYDMPQCPIRVSMSATFPTHKTDAYKNHKIRGIVGGDVLTAVEQKELIARKISSKLQINMVTVSHPEIDDISNDPEITTFDWSVEDNYNMINDERIEAIAAYIKSFDTKNTLILCHAGTGLKLAELLGIECIVDDTPTTKRERLFESFDTENDYMLAATFGCGGTGVSKNRIFRMFMIDVGKNVTYIKQGIGRGLRRDGVVDEIEVIDISGSTKYAKRHRKERIALYKKEGFPFTEGFDLIEVGEYALC